MLATDQLERPNGLVISADGLRAYVADNNNADGGVRALFMFDIKSDGTFANRRAVIRVPDVPTNCTFGGPAEPNTLYITAKVAGEEGEATRFGLYRIDGVNEGR